MTTLAVLIISLSPTVTPSTFLTALNYSDMKPLITARVVQWIVTPDHLLSHNWDFTLILTPNTTLPSSILALTSHIFTIRLLESSDFLSTFPSANTLLLTPTIPPPLLSSQHPLSA
ncbi:hypothetical protein B7494_g4865 [Chlorociboria aeruginascens]|nr:hypothetical protein B7494_g4865 [Chlorociboria aeruginascens]